MNVRARAAGLHELLATAGTANAMAVLERVVRSGYTTELLAGALVEDGVPWTRERATETASFFAALTDPADKAVLRESIVQFIVGFFLPALRLSRTSPNSSARPDDRTTPSQTPRRSRSAGANPRTEAARTSASGTRSSER